MNRIKLTAAGIGSAALIAIVTTLIEVSIPEAIKRIGSGAPRSSVSDKGPGKGAITSYDSGFRVNYLYLDKQSSKLRPILPESVLYSGDRYKIDFTPDRDGYVYIFQADSAGQFFTLFPLQAFKGVVVNQTNPVSAGHRYVLPAIDKSFKLDTTTGRERLFFVFTPAPHQGLESLAARLDNARSQRDQTAISASNRDLELRLTGQDLTSGDQRLRYRGLEQIETDEVLSVAWGGADKVFNVLGQQLGTLCSDCVYGIEFEHR